jgi:hypothetical protein
MHFIGYIFCALLIEMFQVNIVALKRFQIDGCIFNLKGKVKLPPYTVQAPRGSRVLLDLITRCGGVVSVTPWQPFIRGSHSIGGYVASELVWIQRLE